MHKLAIQVLFLLFLVGCDKKHLARIKSTDIPTTANDIHQSGIRNLERKHYKQAIINFESVKSIYPYSSIAEDSLIKLVDIHEIKKEYDDAITAIEELISVYGINQNVEELRYRHAILNYKNLQKQLRDQKLIIKTAQILEVFEEEFPNSQHMEDIKEKITIINGRLVYRELEIGYFYEIQRNYIASLKRYLIANHFSKNNKYRAEILYRIYYCYWMMGLDSEGMKYRNELEEKFKDTKWYKSAQMIDEIKTEKPL